LFGLAGHIQIMNQFSESKTVREPCGTRRDVECPFRFPVEPVREVRVRKDLYLDIRPDRLQALVHGHKLPVRGHVAEEYAYGREHIHLGISRIGAVKGAVSPEFCALFERNGLALSSEFESGRIKEVFPFVDDAVSDGQEAVLVPIVEALKKKKRVLVRCPSVVRLKPFNFCYECVWNVLEPSDRFALELFGVRGDRESVAVRWGVMPPSDDCGNEVVKRASQVMENLAREKANLDRWLLDFPRLERYFSGFHVVLGFDSATIVPVRSDERFKVDQMRFSSV
jgi:hypothetical protein